MVQVLILAAATVAAQDPVVYQDGFETGKPNWTIWAKNAKQSCKVNFLGASTDKAYKGKRSLKLDLTFQDGSYCYWGVPVSIPAAGDLVMSGYVHIEAIPTQTRVGLGYQITLPPSGLTGCMSIQTLSKPTRGWKRFEVGLEGVGEGMARSVVGSPHVLRYLSKIALMYYGRFNTNPRVVLYLDEVKVTGHLPADYATRKTAEIAKETAKHVARVKAWQDRARQAVVLARRARSRASELAGTSRKHADQIAVNGIKHALEIIETRQTPQDKETPVDLITAESLR